MSETMRLLTSPLEEIPITWKAKTIGELAAPQDNAIVDGPFGSNLKVSDYVETGVPVLQGSNITGDTFELRDLRFVSPAKARELNRSLVRVGDLLVVKIGSVGYSAIIDDLDPYDEALIPANLLKATFDQAQVATKYVHHYLTSDIGRTRLIDIASQTAQPALTLGRFKSLIIPVPSLPEQRRIAEILDTADETIRHTERVIAKLRQVKAGLLHDLLTRGLDEHGHLRDPQAHPEQFKDSPLGRIPKEWRYGVLGDVVESSRPIVYGILMPGYGYPGGVPVVKVKDIINDEIKTSGLLLTSPAIDNQYRRSRLRCGDLLFTIRGTVGRTAFVPESLEGANITQDTARISITKANPRFIRQYLDMPKPQAFIDLHTIGLAVRGINLRDVRCIPLALPTISEQNQIVCRLEAHDAHIHAEEATLAKLRQLKRGLMDDLLTGRVRVTA